MSRTIQRRKRRVAPLAAPLMLTLALGSGVLHLCLCAGMNCAPPDARTVASMDCGSCCSGTEDASPAFPPASLTTECGICIDVELPSAPNEAPRPRAPTFPTPALAAVVDVPPVLDSQARIPLLSSIGPPERHAGPPPERHEILRI